MTGTQRDYDWRQPTRTFRTIHLNASLQSRSGSEFQRKSPSGHRGEFPVYLESLVSGALDDEVAIANSSMV